MSSINPPKCTVYDYIGSLIATPSAYSCTEAACVQPPADTPPAHDSLNRLLCRLPPDSETLWTEAEPSVKKDQGILDWRYERFSVWNDPAFQTVSVGLQRKPTLSEMRGVYISLKFTPYSEFKK